MCETVENKENVNQVSHAIFVFEIVLFYVEQLEA
jgi:hypothetical protein